MDNIFSLYENIMDRLSAMRAFVAVVEHGGFTAAARRLRLPLATVSRQVARLEDALGARLLSRTTRRVAATDAGRGYYERGRRILAEIAEAEALAAGEAAALSGHIAVSAPVLLGHNFVVGAAAAFIAAHPGLEIDLSLSDRLVDLIEDGIDVAVRVGALADSRLAARRIGEFRRVVVAAPSYLKRHGVPESPADLARHDCIVSTMHADSTRWRFFKGSEAIVVPVRGRLRTDDAAAVVRAALAGAGLGLAPAWLVREPVARGRLRIVLPSYLQPPTPIHAVHAQARLVSLRVRRFAEFLAGHWSNTGFERAPQGLG
jgi:DNA-binding transcriptional LysR family regulator